MSKSSSPPPIPDPYQLAKAQGQQNVETAVANARLGAINQVTPYGTVSYQFGRPPAVAAAPGAAPGAAGAGAAMPATGPGSAAALAGENRIRSMIGLPALQPGTPQYQQWMMRQQQPSMWGGPGGAAQGGGGMGGLGASDHGGAFAGGGGAGDPGAGSHGGQPTR